MVLIKYHFRENWRTRGISKFLCNNTSVQVTESRTILIFAHAQDMFIIPLS